MSVGVNVTCELRWVSSVLSEADREFLRSKGEELRLLSEAMLTFGSVVYSLSSYCGGDKPEGYVSMAEALKPVVEARDTALAGWEEKAGVFPYLMDRKLCLARLDYHIARVDESVEQGESPWANRTAVDLLYAIDVVEANINGARSVVTALLGYYV